MASITATTATAIGSIAAVIFAKIVWELFLSPLRAFPGPFLARFTDAWRAYLATTGAFDRHQINWHRQWGSTVRIGPKTISLSDPDLIKVVYASKNAWRKTDMYRPNDIVLNGQRISNMFNTQDKAFHDKHTKPIGGFWTLSKVLEAEPLVDETLREFVRKLNQEFVEKDAVCMMDDWISYFTWDATANVSWGKTYGFIEEGKDIAGIINESNAALKYFAPVSQMPWLDNLLDKNPLFRIGPKPLVNGFLYTVRIFTEYKDQVTSTGLKWKDQDLFIDKYNSLKEKYDFVDDQQVITWLMASVLAGGDSTSGAVRPVFYYLAKNEDKYEKLVRELEGARLEVPAQWRDLIKLPYLDACIKEASRLSPGVGLTLEREVPAGGFTLPDGRFISTGTNVGLNPAVVNRDEGVFGDKVDEYIPERWLQTPGESDTEYSKRARRMQETHDLMFGAGSRICLGRHLAKMEMYKLVATLYSTYDIVLKDPEHEWKYNNQWFMFHSDIPMVLTPRATS
ncbi:cytochrome P450 [Sarocladium strictum]